MTDSQRLPAPQPTLDELRARVLVIMAAAEGEPLRIGYATRRIVNEVIAPLLDRPRSFGMHQPNPGCTCEACREWCAAHDQTPAKGD